jgi:hypothetical protein
MEYFMMVLIRQFSPPSIYLVSEPPLMAEAKFDDTKPQEKLTVRIFVFIEY